ncbi:MAG: ABC transporter permease subunit [Desulfuromonadales bacterium]
MNRHVLRRIKRQDRAARYIITGGGLAIIASVILILFLIVEVALPLFRDPRVALIGRYAPAAPAASREVLAVGVDEYLQTGLLIDGEGEVLFFDPRGEQPTGRLRMEAPPGAKRLLQIETQQHLTYSLLWDDGSVTVDRVRFRPVFDAQGVRTFERNLVRRAAFPPPDGGAPLQAVARVGEEGRVRVAVLANGRLEIAQETVATDFLGNEKAESHTLTLVDAAPENILSLALNDDGTALYAGTGQGTLLRWDLSTPGSPELVEKVEAFADGRAITALALVLGDISLAVGDAKGGLSTWFPVRDANGEEKLRQIHHLQPHRSAVAQILPSQRDKSLLSRDVQGVLHLDHMTSERHLLTLDAPHPLALYAFAARGNGVVALTGKGEALLWAVDNPHPEISVGTLFGKVWYESYPAPAWVWQSSAANDDFEPKVSLTPLIFGTLKGTFYAMLLAVPLALLGAIYTSHFGSPRLRQAIKPMVEVMAAIPSVVIGFLAALWFAPVLEHNISGFFLTLAFLPTAFVLAIFIWQGLRRFASLKRIERGYEFIALAPVVILAVAVAWVIGPTVENLLFDGNFRRWLYEAAGARYDQRNSIVIAFALGFAVIPIIFTIAEDSLSNVPSSLKAASLALGASRWQTVWRVIIPSASPGIFAGTMIGFGRAIGETMIVLMATGNTAIMDLSAFNGMRPLSANIAVEIPEAPMGGTLYRILFLSAVILFGFTFILNTAAEIVRQRLRKKYGRF